MRERERERDGRVSLSTRLIHSKLSLFPAFLLSYEEGGTHHPTTKFLFSLRTKEIIREYLFETLSLSLLLLTHIFVPSFLQLTNELLSCPGGFFFVSFERQFPPLDVTKKIPPSFELTFTVVFIDFGMFFKSKTNFGEFQ